MEKKNYKSRIPYHDVWVRNREWGQRPALGSTNRLMKGLYSSLLPVNSWSYDGNPDIPNPGAIFNLEFSPDGSLLVAACEKKSFLMFDPLTRKMIMSATNAHNDCVNCVRFLDSRIFATCSDDKTVALWDARNLRSRLRTLQGHSNWVKNIEFSQKDGLLVTSGFDGSIYTWDINSYTECGFIYNRVFHTNGLMRTRLTPDGSKMIICTTGGYLIVIHDLDLTTLEQDLAGFKPNMYRLMQLSETTIPVAANFTRLFSRRRKKNRVEFIADFPSDDDAEVVSSLQVHPQGWCVLSRNISNQEKSEWTCIHDIQDDPFDENDPLENEDLSSDHETTEMETNGNESSLVINSESRARIVPLFPVPEARPPQASSLQSFYFQDFISTPNISVPPRAQESSSRRTLEPVARNPELPVSSTDVWEALIAIGDERNRRERERGRRLSGMSQQFDSSRMNIVRTSSGLEQLNLNFILDSVINSNQNRSSTDRSNNDRANDSNSVDGAEDNENSNNSSVNERSNSYIILRYRTNQSSNNSEASTSNASNDNGETSSNSSESVNRPSQMSNNGHTVVILSSQSQNSNHNDLGSSSNSYKVPKNHRIHQNKPRLLHYIEECNVGKGFIKELCFSSDGRIICSPFSYGVRLLSFSPDCAELSTCVPETPPVNLYELAANVPHSNTVVSTKFSPTSCLLVSGCLSGKIVYHQPGY